MGWGGRLCKIRVLVYCATQSLITDHTDGAELSYRHLRLAIIAAGMTHLAERSAKFTQRKEDQKTVV